MEKQASIGTQSGYSFPASYAQEGMWLLQKSAPDSSFYNLGKAYRFHGPLNVNALNKSLRTLEEKHETLRTTFVWDQDLLYAMVHPPRHLELPVEDLGSIPTEDREATLSGKVLREEERVFDLEAEFPWRPLLFRVAEEDHILLITFHHICVDEWSFKILLRDLFSFYKSYSNGNLAKFDPASYQYSDYARWQREQMDAGEADAQLAYWRNQLGDEVSALNLPTDYPRPSQLEFEGATEHLILNKTMLDELEALGKSCRTTFFMNLLASFQVLLHRYSGQKDFVVASPVANRFLEEHLELSGLFLNTVALRASLGSNPSVREHLVNVRNTILDAFDNQDVPFRKVVQECRARGLDAQENLHRVMFTINEPAQKFSAIDGLQVSAFKKHFERAKNDLTLFCRKSPQGLSLAIQYSSELFKAATIRRMLSHLAKILQEMVNNPDCRIHELPILNDEEKQRILVEWNQTSTAYPSTQCVHRVFEEQAQKWPDSPAITFGDQGLTYDGLNAEANRLAHFLIKKGVQRESLVGLCMDRSLEMVVAMLAILKAGGAYVPLDPTYPEERLRFIVEDAGIEILVSLVTHQSKLPDVSELILLDDIKQSLREESEANPDSDVSPDNQIYVMFTSGSTGKPKGVSVEHRSVLRLVKKTNYIEFGPDEVFLFMAPPAFDASTFELWGALLHGGRVVILPPNQPSLTEIGGAILKEKVTTVFLTSGLFHLIVDQNIDALKPLRQLITGGDVLSVRHIEKAKKALANGKLIAAYGPTECTTFTTTFEISEGEIAYDSVPIGKPIANTTVYILDAHLQPVPIGVPGELYVGGDGVARGYLNRPELTSQVFIQNPFDQEGVSRLYKTGDFVRHFKDGNIEFLGRTDKQVKIRGHRIEPGEIETVLHEYPTVRSCVVEAMKKPGKDSSLVAYLVLNSNLHADLSEKLSELRSWLRGKLPDFMQPGHFVLLDELPLNSNGKVDRGKLPNPQAIRGETSVDADETLTPLQKRIREVWKEVLELPDVGLHDNFFELGGHSLLAANLAIRLEKIFNRQIYLNSIFLYPTIAAFSESIFNPQEDRVQVITYKPEASPSNPPLFCIHFSESTRSLAKHLKSDRTVYSLESTLSAASKLWREKKKLETSIEQIAEDYIQAIKSLQPVGPYNLLGYCFGGVVAFEIAQKLRQEGESIAFLTLVDTIYRPGYIRPKYSLIQRWFYHGSHILREGTGYLRYKLQKRRELKLRKQQRRKQRMEARKKESLKGNALTAQEEHLDLLRKLQQPFKSQPYPGDVILVQAGNRMSFALSPNKYNGWDSVIQGSIERIQIDCIHEDILLKPNVFGVAKSIDYHLANLNGNKQVVTETV